MTAITAGPETTRNQNYIGNNVLNLLPAAGSAAVPAATLSAIAKVGEHIALASQNVKVEALCQRVSSRASTMGYGALGIMAALALAYATHGPHAYPRVPEPLEKMARIHMQKILQFVPDPEKLELLKIYPNHPDVRDAAAPVLVRLRMHQLKQMRDKLAGAATLLQLIGKCAMLGAATGLGFRGVSLASQMAGLRACGKPGIGALVGEKNVILGKTFATMCLFFLGSGFEAATIPVPYIGIIYASSIPPAVVQITGLGVESPDELEALKFLKVVSLFMSFAVLLGSRMNTILGNNASGKAQFAVGQLLLGAMALGLTGSMEFGANFLQKLALRNRSHDSRQALRIFAHQLLQCGVKNALVGGSASFASLQILKLLQRYNVNPNITQKCRFLLDILSSAAPIVSELLHNPTNP